MPLDGLTTLAMCHELNDVLTGGRIDKIYQPEKDEIVLNVRSLGKMQHLLICVRAGSARIQLTSRKVETPMVPPSFCMLLRKQLGAGKLTQIQQYHFDRILRLCFETVSEMGDMVERRLYLEMMGKHSNLILCDEHDKILDSLRRVNPAMSSVRVVEPGLTYELPTHNHKADPTDLLPEGHLSFDALMRKWQGPLETGLYQVFNGLSPFAAREILYRCAKGQTAGMRAEAFDGRQSYESLSAEEKAHLAAVFKAFIQEVSEKAQSGQGPYPVYDDPTGRSVDYSVIPYECMTGVQRKEYDTLSSLMDDFYEGRDQVDKMKQKSQELRHLVTTNLDRARKKQALQEKQLKDTKGREKERLKGDLITANVWQLKKGMTKASLPNYYEEGQPLVEVRLDVNLTPAQNAQKYYARYNKQKRTEEAVTRQLAATREEVAYLESIMDSIELSDCEQDLMDIREELSQTGYVRQQRRGSGKNLSRSKPISFVTSEGVQGLIGKNNVQNDQLTFRIAQPRDEWFHAKGVPGSHVILKVSQLERGRDYTDQSLLEAAREAALHSKAQSGSNVPVDHTLRMYVRKPAGSRPGFVRYTHENTIFVPVQRNSE